MPEFQVRYTCSGKIQEDAVKFITKHAHKYIISQEFASREHIQCYVETDIVKKTWSNSFNIMLKKQGHELNRRDKYVEIDKGVTKEYVCKGNNESELPKILAKRGFTDDDIVCLHKKYWETRKLDKIDESLILPPEPKIEKVKKTKAPTFMMIIRNELEDEYPNLEWDMKHRVIVFKKLMFKLGQGCKNLDHIIISRMTYGVLNSLIKDKKEWLEYWYQKAFGEPMFEEYADIELDNKLDDDTDEKLRTMLNTQMEERKRKLIRKKYGSITDYDKEENVRLCIIEDD